MYRLFQVCLLLKKSIVSKRSSLAYAFLFSFTFILFSPSSAQAGPWTKGLGSIYAKIGQGAYLADSFRDASGKLQEGVSYLGATTSLYAEIGLLNVPSFGNLQIQLSLPYLIARNTFENKAYYTQGSFADGTIGLQWSPSSRWRLPFVSALRANLKVPMYDVSALLFDKALEKKGVSASNFPAAGDGQLDATFWLSLGKAFRAGPIPMFFVGEVGYRLRTEIYVGRGGSNEFGDNFMFMAQLGATFFKRVTVGLSSSGVIPFTPEDGVTKGYISTSLSLYIPFYKGLAFEASFDPTLWAVNSAEGTSFSIGLSYNK